MKEFEFYNVAKEGTIRQAVADMMTSNKHLSKLEGEAYYEVEDAICNLIQDNMYHIKNFVQDLITKEEIEGYIVSNYNIEEVIPDELMDRMLEYFNYKYYKYSDDRDNYVAEIIEELYEHFKDEIVINSVIGSGVNSTIPKED